VSVQRDGRTLVENVDFEAYPGTFTAITGPNGAGKTTLLKAIVGLLPYDGSVHLGLDELSTLSRVERAQRVAYVPQRSQLNSALRVREVVALGRYAHQAGGLSTSRGDEAAIDAALEAMDLGAIQSRSYTRLSGGEQRRVLIARALATQAPVLLLDEPTEALDIAHGLDLFERLRGIVVEGRAVVAVLHELDAVHRHADRVVLLERGRSIADGSPKDVLSAERLERIYGVRPVPGGGLGFERLR
jgi:iron complex transport system ATP-binding protein